jgi:hypothetical protein
LFIPLTNTIVLIPQSHLQAGLFSATLTSFLIDSKQSLSASPADQMVYYLQQNVELLTRISEQIYSMNPQTTLPFTPPSPLPAFTPLTSDVRVNAFWFMSLVFSLSAALLAIFVQQWVRDYMRVFQQYSDPLKRARVRQYLHDGCEEWYMLAVAEAIRGLLHVSLFLFVLGLCDSVLRINTAICLSTSPRWHHLLALHLHNFRTHHISQLTLPEFVLYSYMVSGPEIEPPDIQGSELGWSDKMGERGQGTGKDATRDGRDRRTQGARRTVNPMVTR